MEVIGDIVTGPNGTDMPFRTAMGASGLVFLSGQLALRQGKISGDDVKTQTDVIFDNIEDVLEKIGLKIENIVKSTVWLRRGEDFPDFNSAYASRLGSHLPARSTVLCDLVIKEALVEIEVVASHG